VEEEVGLPRFPCMAHTLQLVLKEMDKQQAYCNVITKARGLVNIRISSVATCVPGSATEHQSVWSDGCS